MTEIEETLSRVLIAEADRHEPPVFDAYRIAGAATAKRRRWRPTLFALAAAVIGTGGVGGAMVFANSGGHRHQQPVPPPAVAAQAVKTFQSRPVFANSGGDDAAVFTWVHRRAEVDGMKDVWTTAWQNPWRLEVAVPIADRDWLNRLDAPATLQFRPVADAGRTPVSALPLFHETQMRTYQLAKSSNGQTGAVWAIQFIFDDAEGKVFAAFTAENAGKPVEVLIDGAPTPLIVPQAITRSGFEFTAGTSQDQIHVLTVALGDPVPESLQNATVTVSTR